MESKVSTVDFQVFWNGRKNTEIYVFREANFQKLPAGNIENLAVEKNEKTTF